MITVINDRGWKREFPLKDIFILNECQQLFTIRNDSYIELTATHGDLEHIAAEFHGIPLPRSTAHRNSFTWHGNMAKIILANL